MNIFTDIRRTTPTTSKTVVAISDCYNVKDGVKALGYSWNPLCKRWEKVSSDPIEDITKIFEQKIATVEDYERLYTSGTLCEGYDFSDDQFDRVRNAIT